MVNGGFTTRLEMNIKLHFRRINDDPDCLDGRLYNTSRRKNKTNKHKNRPASLKSYCQIRY